MKKEEIKNYNRLCAEFLGYSNPITDKDFYFVEKKNYEESSSIPKLLELNFEKRFHSDWNCIMEVLEKIYSLDCYYDKYIDFNSSMFSNGEIQITTNKEAVVQAINQFLIWYNENNL